MNFLYVGGNFTLLYKDHTFLTFLILCRYNSTGPIGPIIQIGLVIFFYKDLGFNIDAKYSRINTDEHLYGAVKRNVHVDVNS